jgi:predicted porin
VGVGNIHVAYAQAKIDNGNVFTDALGDGSDQKPKAFTVAYTHGLSKRTTGYVGFAYVDYDDLNWAQAGALGYSVDGHNGTAGPTGETVDKTKLFFVGLDHKF